MNDRNLPIIVTGLLAALVIVVVAILIVVSGRNDGPAATPTPSLATTSASATPAGSKSAAPSLNATPSTEPTPLASSSAAASSSPLPAPLASITFVGLKLDSTADPAGLPRTISFSSDFAGAVTAKIASSTGGKSHMCLQVGAKVIGCNDITKGTFTGTTKQAHANWQVTLQGTAAAAPTVDVTITFQSLAPSATIAHARFDGTDFPGTNGIQARFTARGPGDAHLVAEWGGHPFQYEIDLFDETSSTGNASFPNQGPSTNVDQAFPVTAGDWRLVLQNTEGGFGITDLTATISWP